MRFLENYRRICEAAEAEITGLLGRALTAQEQYTIWNAGTLPWLEMRVQVPVRQAHGPEEIETILADAALDLDDKLVEMIAGLAGMLVALLRRELTAAERQQLEHLSTAIAIMRLGEDMMDAAPTERESLLRHKLAEL